MPLRFLFFFTLCLMSPLFSLRYMALAAMLFAMMHYAAAYAAAIICHYRLLDMPCHATSLMLP